MNPSVAVVTATTGRNTLWDTVRSVNAQTYPCQHYVFFDGVSVNQKLPIEVSVTRLPVATGGNGMMNGGICAAAPFLVKEDLICFLDDDNWIEQNHIESLVRVMGDNQYAYSLRNLVNPDGSFHARDDGESIGHFGDLVDVNCYMFRRLLACSIAPLWYNTTGTLMIGDRFVWNMLKEKNVSYAASGQYTVNYRLNPNRDLKPYFFLKNITSRAKYPDGFPWAKA